MKKLLILLCVACSGCASLTPYITCKLSTGTAVVNQGYMGIGVGQSIPDADKLCAPLAASAPSK